MKQLLAQFQKSLKVSSDSIFKPTIKLFVRILSGLVIGLTLALIGQELMSYKNFSFMFTTVLVLLLFLRMTRQWSFVSIIIFDLICVLIGLALKMYILLAPGA